MYRNGQILTHLDHRFILHHGALGDVICSLPALIHARERTNPELKMTVYCPPWQVELIDHLLKPYGEFDVRSMDEVPLRAVERAEAWGPEVSTSMNAAAYNTHTRNRVHMVDYAFHFLIDATAENMVQRSYPTAALVGKRPAAIPRDNRGYVVFPVGATSDNKLFKAPLMAAVMDWVAKEGYLPVLVGTKISRTHADNGNGKAEQLVIRDEVDKLPALLDPATTWFDMREKTTLLELRDLLAHAEAVVGVDGGTLHLAGTTQVPIVYAMGTTLPKHRYIARNGDYTSLIRYIVPRDLECAGCQSNWMMTRWDFRFCVYGDNKCMDMLHADDFINALKELGL